MRHLVFLLLFAGGDALCDDGTSPPNFSRGSFVKLLDGGQLRVEEAPFSAIRDWARHLDAGTIVLNGQTISIRTPVEGDFALPIEGGKLVDSRIDSYVPLTDVERCRQVLISRSKRGLLLEPSPSTPGSDLLAVVDLARDAGATSVAFLLPPPPVSEAARRAIALTIDSHITDTRSCFGANAESLAQLVIGPKGRIVQVRIKKPSDDARRAETISKCVLERAKAWEFAPPVGGGVIVVNRVFDFRPRQPEEFDCSAALKLLQVKGSRGTSLADMGTSCELSAPLLVSLSMETQPGRYRAMNLGQCSNATVQIVAPDSVKAGVLGVQINLRRTPDRFFEIRGRVGELNPPLGTGALALCGSVALRAKLEKGEWSVLAAPEPTQDGGAPRR